MKPTRWGLAFLLFTAGVVCGITIERFGAPRGWISEVQEDVPNVDFSEMAIATRPVTATVSGGAEKVRVKAWERCALGYATCDQRRQRTVEAVCLGSRTPVVIDEKDWPAFRRIPGEDLQGTENVPKDMKLCEYFTR